MFEKNEFIRSRKSVPFPNPLLYFLSDRLQAEIVEDLEGLV
jgi:hypothetical protein